MKVKNSIRICMIVSDSLKKDPRVQREAISAHKDGFDVVFIGIEDDFYDISFLNSLPYKCDIIKVPKSIRNSKNIIVRVFRKSYRFLSFITKLIKHNPDIIHCNDLDMLTEGVIAAKFCKAKVVYDSHELNCDIANEKPDRTEKNKIRKERKYIKKVNAVISVSNSAAQVLSNFYQIKPVVVTNSSFRANFNHYTVEKSLSFEVLYHGIMSENRGYEEFVLSAKYINEGIKLIMRGYGSLKEELIRIVDENNLQDKVVFAEPCEINELIPKAAESHVGVVLTKPVNSNYKYTVGNKLFEYLNAGIPVILSNIPEHNLLNDKFNFGIVINVTPQSVADAINEMAKDRIKYETLRINAVNTSEIMCWENEVQKLLAIYRKILE